MSTGPVSLQAIQSVHDQQCFVRFLRDELNWPVEDNLSYDDLTYGWSPQDVGLRAEDLRGSALSQLRPFVNEQPWGIFFIHLSSPTVYLTELRKIIRAFAPKRQKLQDHPTWNPQHLLFICTPDWKNFTFAHFEGEDPSERKILVDAQKDRVLDEMYKKLFFEKKEAALLKHRIGLTDLNRRRVVSNDEDPAAKPTIDDIQKFVRKVEKYRPKVIAFVTKMEIFENCFRPLYPSVNRQRGKQDFLIGDSEVWLLGSTSGRVKDTGALEQVFEDLANRLSALEKEGGQVG